MHQKKPEKKSQYEEGIKASFGLAGEREGVWEGPLSHRNLVSVVVFSSDRFSCIQHVQEGSLVENVKAVGLEVGNWTGFLRDGTWLAIRSLSRALHEDVCPGF